MEKKTVAFFIVFLLAGLVGGYILNYTIFQPQIQSLRNELDTLNFKLDAFSTSYQKSIADLTAKIAILNATSNTTNSSTNGTQQTNNETISLVEQIIFSDATATKDGANFNVAFTIQSTGTAPALLESLYLNGVLDTNVPNLNSIVINGTSVTISDFLGLYIYPGDTASGTVSLTGGGNFVSGNTLEIAFVSARTVYSQVSSVYSKTLVLP